MILIRQWFVLHVFHSCVKVAHNDCWRVSGCVVQANQMYKPGVSVGFTKLVLVSPLRSCCGGVLRFRF